MENIEKKGRKSNAETRVEKAMDLIKGKHDIGSRLALMAVEEALQAEVQELAGIRYSHDENPNKRWGSNLGSVYFGHQKHSIPVPRVRNQTSGKAITPYSRIKLSMNKL